MIVLHSGFIASDQEAVIGAGRERLLHGCYQGVIFVSNGLQGHLAEGLNRVTVLFAFGGRGAQDELSSQGLRARLPGIDKAHQAVAPEDC